MVSVSINEQNKSTTETLKNFPSDDELSQIFQKVEQNEDIKTISNWVETNKDDDLDEREVLKRGLALGDPLFKKFVDAVGTIKSK